jgi:hypothetical protein
MFCIAALMTLLSKLTLKEYHFQIEAVFEIVENLKPLFLTGLLTLTLQIGNFGEHFSNSECLWTCSAMGIAAPDDLIKDRDPSMPFVEGELSLE